MVTGTAELSGKRATLAEGVGIVLRFHSFWWRPLTTFVIWTT